jgi:asparagine synthase (glutamine-hydrolysing)
MCGITGFLDLACSMSQAEMEATATVMAEAIRHRGPDDWGCWADETGGIAFGHRRLSIIDLTPGGRQPMFSKNGRYVIVYNGEVYNYKALAHELQSLGHVFHTTSDTEVMLTAICQWGLRAAVERFVGMFAFALWDRQERRLSLVRDRLGVKPLYYGWMGRAFLFGSELKALRAYPAFQAGIDRDALALYFRHSDIPAPFSIYQGVRKLPPAAILTIPFSESPVTPEPEIYWSARLVAELGAAHPLNMSTEEALTRLDALLREAIGLRMIADVPLGAFLSGGIDSSLVVALMQAQSSMPVKTYTIGFHEAAYNEAEYAREVAHHLGTNHTELYVSPQEAMNVIPRLPFMYDEPFADSSQIPTFLVSELTRRSVTVSLSGDGGDELFGGYSRYFWGTDIWRKTGGVPRGVKRAISRALLGISAKDWEIFFSRAGSLLPTRFRQSNPVDKIQKLAELLPVDSPEALYSSLVSTWKAPTELVLNSREPQTILTDQSHWAKLPGFLQWMMYMDLVTYLPDDILVKLDRASMAVSLEAREPLLDHRLVEFAWSLPVNMKVRNGKGKWLLRQALYRYVPEILLERPKTGFAIPIDSWLRGELRPWAEALLDEQLLRRQGYLDPQPVRQKWREHQEGRRNWQNYLWNVLMFQAWLQTRSEGA